MGEPENRSIRNGQPHAGCVEAERDGLVPSMAVFQRKEEAYFFFVIHLHRLFHSVSNTEGEWAVNVPISTT